MKKLLLTMVGVLVAFAAGAANWYISGSFQGWSHANANYKFTEKSAGVFEFVVPADKDLSGEFLICQGTDGKPDWNNKVGTNGSKVKEGVAYNYVVGGNNFTMDGTVKGATVTLDTNAKTLLVSGASAENEYTTVYLVGDFGSGWNEASTAYPLTLKAGTQNVWQADYDLKAATSYMKMRAGNYIYGTGGGDIAIVSGQTYTASQSGNAFSLKSGKYHFEFVLDYNAEQGELTVTADGDTPVVPDPDPVVDYTKWYVNVIGGFNDWKDNGISPDAEGLVMHEGLAIGTSEFKVKIWDGAADAYYSTGTAIAQGEWVKIDGDATANMTITGATEGQKFNVEFNCATTSIKVTAVGGDTPVDPDPVVDYTKWYVSVIGGFNDWKDNGISPDAEGLVMHEGLAIGTSEFKVKIWDGAADAYYSTGTAIAQGEWVKIDGDATANMTITGATEGQKFNVEFNCATTSIKVTAVGGDTPVVPDPDPEQPLNVTFIFNTEAGLAELTPAVPAVSSWTTDPSAKNNAYCDIDKTYSKDGVSFTNEKLVIQGTTVSCSRFYSMGGSLQARFYKNNNVTYSAPEGYVIEKMVFESDKASNYKMTLVSGQPGTLAAFDATSKTATWTGSSKSVVFTATGTTRVMTVDVTLAKEGGDTPVDPDPVVDYTKWYVNVIGGFNDWKDNGISPDAEGLVMHEGLAIGTSEFKVKIWDGAADAYYSTGTAIAQGEWVKIDGNNDINMTIAGATEGQKFNVEFNCATTSIKVTAVGGDTPVEPDPEYPVLYFLGGNTGWEAGETNVMAQANGVYTISIEKLSAEFKIADDKWSADNSWTSDNRAMELDTDYTCFTQDNSPNMGMAQTILNANVTFDYKTKTIKVTGTVSEQPAVVAYVIKGTFTDPIWTPCQMQPVAENAAREADNMTYAYECSPANETGELLIVKTEDGVEKAWYKAAADDVLNANGSVTLSTSGAENLKYDFTNFQKVKFVFNPATGELTSTGTTGIAGIAADYDENAEYYNMQGVRVSGQPAPGLYIVVRGTAATKEYLR